MKRMNQMASPLVGFSSGASLGGKVSRYREKRYIYTQGLLTSSAEERLARVLLRLAHLDKNGSAVVEIPILSHRVLAEMVGTTRPRVTLFMNRFRKQGFINYDGGLEVHPSLRKVLRRC
jgi:CRP-like cAMP-binding protein